MRAFGMHTAAIALAVLVMSRSAAAAELSCGQQVTCCDGSERWVFCAEYCINWTIGLFPSECTDWAQFPPNDPCVGLVCANTTCADTLLTDDYVRGVNMRTRCVSTEVSLGTVEGGDGFSVNVSIVYNEGRPPPEELYAGFGYAETGPYGTGGWLSVDKIFTDEGVSWQGSEIKGQRGDANGNGYVGYTLHTPYGSRTYDYPVTLRVWPWGNGDDARKPVGLFRSEPFDGSFLEISLGSYRLFQYPDGPSEFYSWGLSPTTSGGPLATARLLTRIEANYAPPGVYQRSRTIFIARGGSPGAPNLASNAIASIHAEPKGPFVDDWALEFSYVPEIVPEMDDRMTIVTKRKPGALATTIKIKGFGPESLTTPGRQKGEETKFAWSESKKLEKITHEVWNKEGELPAYTSVVKYERLSVAADAVRVRTVTSTETLPDGPLGDDVAQFCDAPVGQGTGTTVTLARNEKHSYEYGGPDVQHRLLAYTDPLGTRTQFVYNGKYQEPARELTDVVRVGTPTDSLTAGIGEHIEYQWINDPMAPFNAALFPADTFVSGTPTSNGVPLRKRVSRWPDGLEIRRDENYDPAVLRPRTVVDKRQLTDKFTYFQDGPIETHTRQGLTTKYVRTTNEPDPLDFNYNLISIEVKVSGNAGLEASLGKYSWRVLDGRLCRTTETGVELDPQFPAPLTEKPIKIEKWIERDPYGAPVKTDTRGNGTSIAETRVRWENNSPTEIATKLPNSSHSGSTSANGPDPNDPDKPAGVDGLGAPKGKWPLAAAGERLDVFMDVDALGNYREITLNGIGEAVGYGAGTDGTLKTSLSSISPSPNGTQPIVEEVIFPGTTNPICE